MHKIVSIILLSFFVAIAGNAVAQSVEQRSVAPMSAFSPLEPASYILLGEGYGNIEPLVYEVGFAPQFRIAANRFPNFGFIFTPNFVLRMRDQFSHPIRTPSYMPKGTLFYHVGNDDVTGVDRFAFLTIGHHSNGQEGSFFEADSLTINTFNGSFSSNYASLGYEWISPNKRTFNPTSNFRLSSTFYFVNKIIRSMYGPLRFQADLQSTLYLTGEKNNFFRPEKTRAALVGKMNVTWLAMGVKDAEPIDLKRLVFSYTLSYQPSFISDVAFFTRFYYGQDYYNINFERTLKVLQFGFSVRNISFR